VFLEVYVDGRWWLLDPEACTLYDEYDPAKRILPGPRYAYDKGSDPRKLVLSPDWEKWKRQTAAYFSKFDVTQLPVGTGRRIASPEDVFIAANSPIWQALTSRCEELGHRVPRSFNTDFDNCLRMAKGSHLIIACVGNEVVLPEERYDEYLPLSVDELRRKTAAGERGTASRQLEDGTQVLLLYAGDNNAMLELVKTLTLPAES
jgi:hypothetical protein